MKICSSIEAQRKFHFLLLLLLLLVSCFALLIYSVCYENNMAKYSKSMKIILTHDKTSKVSVLPPQHLMHHWITESVGKKISTNVYILVCYQFFVSRRNNNVQSVGWLVRWIHIWMEQRLSVCQFIEFGWCQIQSFSWEMCVAQCTNVENGLLYHTQTVW